MKLYSASKLCAADLRALYVHIVHKAHFLTAVSNKLSSSNQNALKVSFFYSWCVLIFSGNVNSNWSCWFSAIIKPAPSPAKTDYFSYYFRRWCCFTWCSKEGKSNKGMYTILLFSIWFSVVTSVNLAWENSRHLSALLLVFPPNDVWETSAEIPYWWRVIRSG